MQETVKPARAPELQARLSRLSARGAGRIHRILLGLYGALSRRLLPGGYALPPLHYLIEVTRRCNLRCEMCQFAEWLRTTPGSEQGSGELTTEEWKRIIDQTTRFSLVTFTGGEPWVREDFAQILEYTARKRRVHFISNGTRFRRDEVERVVDLAPRRLGMVGLNAVGISIHGLATTHDRIVGRVGAFDDALQTVRAVTERRAASEKACPLVHVTCVVQNDNLAGLHQLPAVVAEAGADVLNLALESHQADLPGFGSAHPADYAADDLRRPRIERTALFSCLLRVCEEARRVGLELRLPDIPLDSILGYYNDGMDLGHCVCRTGWTAMALDAQGGVYPCFFCRVGDARSQPLATIWNGSEMRAFRRKLADGVHPCCQGCCNLQHLGMTPDALRSAVH